MRQSDVYSIVDHSSTVSTIFKHRVQNIKEERTLHIRNETDILSTESTLAHVNKIEL